MADVSDNAGIKGPPSESFRPMESLLETWLAGARLPEIARIVQLAKTELARRGITPTWSIRQDGVPFRVVTPD